MRSFTSLMAGLLVATVAGMGPPASAWAQARGEQMSPSQQEQFIRTLRDGSAESVAAAISREIARNPAAARQLAQALGELASTRGEAFLTAAVEKACSNIVTGTPGPQGNAAIQQFAVGVTIGTSKAVPNQTAQFVQSITAAALTGAAKTEATVGEMARVVAAGVVEALVTTKTSIAIADIAQLVQNGVSQGASKIVGSQVTVTILSTDDKPVSDVQLTKADGQKLDPGNPIIFISVPKLDDTTKTDDVSPS